MAELSVIVKLFSAEICPELFRFLEFSVRLVAELIVPELLVVLPIKAVELIVKLS